MTGAAARTILIADDDDDVREMVATVLSSRGYALIHARSGREALDRLHQVTPKPQLILLDLMMAEMDGAQFLAAQHLDGTLASIPVVVMTAAGPAPERDARLPVAAWLYKPIKLAQLLAIAAQYCDGAPAPPPGPAPTGPSPDRKAAFLARRRDELPLMRKALVHDDHEALRVIGHNLKGVAASYGFPTLGVLGAELETAAMAKDIGTARTIVDRMARQLSPALD